MTLTGGLYNIPVPKVTHFSSPSEADQVGSDFLILQYVEVRMTYKTDCM